MKAMPYLVAALAAAALAAAGGLLVSSQVAGGGIVVLEPSRDAALWPALPDSPSERWRVDLDGWSADADSDYVYAVAVGEPSRLVQFDRKSGEIVGDFDFEGPGEPALLGIVEGIAVVSSCPGSECTYQGVDPGAANPVWEIEADEEWVEVIGGSIVLQSIGSISVLDPESGEPMRTFRGDRVDLDWFESVLYVVDGDTLEAYDVAGDFRRVMAPVEIQDRDAFVIVDDLLVVGRGNELWTSDGRSSLGRQFTLPSDTVGIWNGGGREVVVELERGEAQRFLIDEDGDLSRAWTADGGTLGQLPGIGAPPILMFRDDDAIAFVDPETGSTTLADDGCCEFGFDGLIINRGATAIAYDYLTGEETWSIETSARDSAYATLVEEGSVVFDYESGELVFYD